MIVIPSQIYPLSESDIHIEHSRDSQKANVLGVGINAINMEQALERVADALNSRQKGYVCFVNVHGVMEAQRDSSLVNIYASALLAAPDGMPTVWVGHHQGHMGMERVAGPDLMIEVIKRNEFCKYTHFLCGGKDGIAQELRDKLIARCPRARIVGVYTPPFGPMSDVQEKEFIAMIDRLKPDIIWVGISTPKQERFMAQYISRLNTTLMFGVGAAFDFHTGRIVDCADWVKRAGLQWAHRFIQDPRHLWRRHLRNNPSFIFRMVFQLIGFKSYSLQQPVEIKVPFEIQFKEDCRRPS